MNYYGIALRNTFDEEKIIEALSFIEKTKISEKVFPQYSVSPHIMALMPSIADLVLHPSEEVRRSIRSVLISIPPI